MLLARTAARQLIPVSITRRQRAGAIASGWRLCHFGRSPQTPKRWARPRGPKSMASLVDGHHTRKKSNRVAMAMADAALVRPRIGISVSVRGALGFAHPERGDGPEDVAAGP